MSERTTRKYKCCTDHSLAGEKDMKNGRLEKRIQIGKCKLVNVLMHVAAAALR